MRTLSIELNEFQVEVSGIDYRPDEPVYMRGHPDNWHDGVAAELNYDVVSVTRYGEDQDDIQVLTEQERQDWLGDNYEALDSAIMSELK